MRETVPLYLSIASRILEDYPVAASKAREQLPSEAELTVQYRVSRSTIREALSYLSSRNRVEKIHGVGTFLLPVPDSIQDGIETLAAYVDTIARGGRTPGDIILSASWVEVPKELTKAGYQHSAETGRELTAGRAIFVESYRTADASKIIYCHDFILPPFSERSDPQEIKRLRQAGTNLLDLIEATLGADTEYSQLRARARTAHGEVAKVLEVASGSPILELYGVTYARGNQPAYFSRNWFLTDEYEFQIVRRKPIAGMHGEEIRGKD